jgi:NADH-quinone oxidoreductase subunit J
VPSAATGPSAADGRGIAVADVADHDANIEQLADSLFTDHVFAFELTSVLLVVAVAGTVLMTRKMRKGTDG